MKPATTLHTDTPLVLGREGGMGAKFYSTSFLCDVELMSWPF